MRPFITYFESVIIFTGVRGSALWSATSTAASSSAWFDCESPGTRIDLFRGWFVPHHIPPPHCAFSFPLFIHDPSVYICRMSSTVGRPCRGRCNRCAGSCVKQFSFVKILKHSDRFDFAVIDGSKIISPLLFVIARSFFSFRRCVSDSESLGGFLDRLNLGRRLFSTSFAMHAHFCGFLHPRFLSDLHSVHAQLLRGWWLVFFSFPAVEDRSLIDFTLCMI